MATMGIQTLVKQIKRHSDCRVYAPSGLPTIATHDQLPEDVIEFYGPDWTDVSPRQIHNLAERMFDAAQVPASIRQTYYRAFNQYIYTGTWQR